MSGFPEQSTGHRGGNTMNDSGHRHDEPRMRSKGKWVLIGFIAIAAYFLITEHKAHLSGWLSAYGIWLLLLACPLLHMFMHGGHGGHGGHGTHRDDGGATSDQQPEGQKKW
jgi:SNF family Na+-dependent transporter